MTNQPPQQPGSGAWPGAYRQQPYQPSQPGPFGQPGFGQPGIPAPGQPAGPGGFPQPPKKRHTGLIIGLVIGLIVVLGGGSTGLYFALSGNGDSTNTNTAKGGSSSTNATPPVDLTTVDPCGFVTVSSFDGRAQRASQTKQSEVRITPLSYTECEIDVTLPAKAGVVDVDIQLLSIPVLRTQIDPSDYNKTTQGKLTIYKPKATGKQSCQEGVELPGQYGVTIDADALVPPPGDLLIEGAGGALVPVTRTLLYADLFARWQIPVIVCARTALASGSLRRSVRRADCSASGATPVPVSQIMRSASARRPETS